MDKAQAWQLFWSGFGLASYDETTVPGGEYAPTLPYLTYSSFSSDSLGNMVPMSVSLWYRSTSWADITAKADEIGAAIGMGGKIVPFDGGAIWITRGVPFAQRMTDEDDTIRRIYINLSVEFLSQN